MNSTDRLYSDNNQIETVTVHSNPFAICVHGTQEGKAVGSILWYNYFGSIHETSQTSLGAISKLLNDYLVSSAGSHEKLNPLNEYQLYHIKLKGRFLNSRRNSLSKLF
jgi:hypothetical protein